MDEDQIEEELDAIVLGLATVLKSEQQTQDTQKQVKDLLSRLSEFLPDKTHIKSHTNEFIHDTLEVCAMIFQALEGLSSMLHIPLFTYQFIEKLLLLVMHYVHGSKKRKRLVEGRPTAQTARSDLACDVLFRFLQVARYSKDALEYAMCAWQYFDISSWIIQVNTTSKQVQYLTFLSEIISKKSLSAQPLEKKKALQYLLGNKDIDEWKVNVWEKKWQVYTSSKSLKAFVPSSEQARAWISSILDGFTISQDPESSSHIEDTTQFLAAVDMEKWMGLRVGVDVSLIKNGVKHAMWHDPLVETPKKISRKETLQVFEEGYTIGIRGIQARCLKIHQLCRHLEAELGQYVNANIYYTPAHEQGFEWHIDDHCVFVVQVIGKKLWHLGKSVNPLPLLYETTGNFTKDTNEILLHPGDVLYIPRGTPHCAHTRGLTESSLHATIGIEIPQEHTFQDICKQLAQGENVNVSESSEIKNLLRKGLMSWHLESDETFNRQVLDIFHHMKGCDEEKVSQSGWYDRINDIRQKILKERKKFLDGRGSYSFHRAFMHNFFKVN